MKKIILYLVIICCGSSCSNPNENSTKLETPISFNKLKAYNNNIDYYSYNIDPAKTGIYRIYLDTISNIISQYTTPKEINQSDILESFGIKSSTLYSNYKNTNIDYIIYEINRYEVNNVTSDIKLAPAKLMFSHETNTDKFVFKKFNIDAQIIFSNDSPNFEYYKKMY